MPIIDMEVWKDVHTAYGVHTVIFDRQRVAQDIFNELETHLKIDGRLPDEYFLLNSQWKDGALFPRDAEIICSADFGRSEGIYLDISVRYEKKVYEFNDTGIREWQYRWVTETFTTGKTLGDSLDDLDKMNLVAASVTAAFYGNAAQVRERYAKIESGEVQPLYPQAIMENNPLDEHISTAKSEILNLIDDFVKKHGAEKAFDELCEHLNGYNKDSRFTNGDFFDFTYELPYNGHAIVSSIYLENGKLRLQDECEVLDKNGQIEDDYEWKSEHETSNDLEIEPELVNEVYHRLLAQGYIISDKTIIEDAFLLHEVENCNEDVVVTVDELTEYTIETQITPGIGNKYNIDDKLYEVVNVGGISGFATLACVKNGQLDKSDARVESVQFLHNLSEKLQMKSDNEKYVEENSGEFEKVKWYANTHSVDMVYYNPDSDAGGQLVTNCISFDLIKDVVEEYPHFNTGDFFSHLEQMCSQTLVDIGDKDFKDSAKEFVDTACCLGETGESLESKKKLLKLAGVEKPIKKESLIDKLAAAEQKAKEQQSNKPPSKKRGQDGQDL